MYQDPVFTNEISGILKEVGPVSGPSREVNWSSSRVFPCEHGVRLTAKGEGDRRGQDIREHLMRFVVPARNVRREALPNVLETLHIGLTGRRLWYEAHAGAAYTIN
jgi:hypothetical protein